jgi:lysophospholipase L1-like esterase
MENRDWTCSSHKAETMKIIACNLAVVTALGFGLVSVRGDDTIELKKGDRIVFLGDSITQAGVGPKGYVTLIKNALAEKQKDLALEVIGAGISGNKVPDLQKRLDKDVLQKKPALVVIYIGINDVWHGENDPKKGTPKDKFQDGLKDIITKIKAGGANVLLCTPTVIGEKTAGANKLDGLLDEYSDISRKVAKEMKVPLCDLRQAFLDYLKANNPDNKEKNVLTSDRVHLNDAGNRLVAATILKALGVKLQNFTLGKDTTVVNGPLDKDGRVDYVAALNGLLSKGVTPDNNANVLLWKALGPHPERAVMPPEYFKWLGAEPPEKGDYFVDVLEYMKTRLKVEVDRHADAIHEDLSQAGLRPWSAKKYAFFADWLKDNEKPLALVAEAGKRTHYFSPLVPRGTEKEPGALIASLLPSVQKCRGLGQALVVRAMLHLGDGRNDEAWQDLQACHRLGRQVARGATLIENLVGLAIDNIASEGDLVFLDSVKMNEKQVLACLQDLQKLPDMPGVGDAMDRGERFVFLDSVMILDRKGLKALAYLKGGFAGFADQPVDPQVHKNIARANLDPALRNGNRWYDRTVAATRLPDRSARDKAMREIENDIKALKGDLTIGELIRTFVDPDTPPEVLGKTLGDVLITLLLPATIRVQQAKDRNEQVQRNLQIAFALGAYQKANGGYPKKLEALVPKYLPTVPLDLFTGKSLVYLPSDRGYLLYSFGMNGLDEQGRTYEDDPPGDDLRVRMPLPALPPKKN